MRKPRGRPAREQRDEVKSAMLSVRLRPDLETKLKQAAFSNNRSVSEEVETRMMESFADDEIRDRFDNFYRLLRSYLQTLARRMSVMDKLDLSDHLAALNVGFDLIILAAFKGALKEERIKQFWLREVPELGKLRHGSKAANIAIDAFTTLTLAGLASIDPLALSQWIKDQAEKPA